MIYRLLDRGIQHRAWSFAPNGDLFVLLASSSAQSYSDPDVGEIPLLEGDRLVLRLDGATGTTLEARTLPLPEHFVAVGDGVDAGGRVVVVGQSLSDVTNDERTGVSFENDQRVMIHWGVDGNARVISSESAGSTAPGTLRIAPLGTSRLLVLQNVRGMGIRREVIGSEGRIERDDFIALTVDGGLVTTEELALHATEDELVLALLATGDVQVGDAVLVGDTPATVAFAMDTAGELVDPVRLELPEASLDPRPRAVTRLADGRYMVVANRMRFGQESLIVEDVGAISIGPAFVPSGTISGYETRGLSALADGRVVWAARHWGGQVIRPFAMPPSFTAILAVDRLLDTQDMLLRE